MLFTKSYVLGAASTVGARLMAEAWVGKPRTYVVHHHIERAKVRRDARYCIFHRTRITDVQLHRKCSGARLVPIGEGTHLICHRVNRTGELLVRLSALGGNRDIRSTSGKGLGNFCANATRGAGAGSAPRPTSAPFSPQARSWSGFGRFLHHGGVPILSAGPVSVRGTLPERASAQDRGLWTAIGVWECRRISRRCVWRRQKTSGARSSAHERRPGPGSGTAWTPAVEAHQLCARPL